MRSTRTERRKASELTRILTDKEIVKEPRYESFQQAGGQGSRDFGGPWEDEIVGYDDIERYTHTIN